MAGHRFRIDRAPAHRDRQYGVLSPDANKFYREVMFELTRFLRLLRADVARCQGSDEEDFAATAAREARPASSAGGT